MSIPKEYILNFAVIIVIFYMIISVPQGFLYGLTEKELFEYYYLKNKENFNRYQNGY